MCFERKTWEYSTVIGTFRFRLQKQFKEHQNKKKQILFPLFLIWLVKPYKKIPLYECKLKTQSIAKTAGWCREKNKEFFLKSTSL